MILKHDTKGLAICTREVAPVTYVWRGIIDLRCAKALLWHAQKVEREDSCPANEKHASTGRKISCGGYTRQVENPPSVGLCGCRAREQHTLESGLVCVSSVRSGLFFQVKSTVGTGGGLAKCMQSSM